MVDMSQFIVAKSDQLNADDLMDAPRTITITKVTAQPDAAEQPVSIHYEGGEGRPWKPCKTMRRILVGVWGKDASKYVGRSLRLYRDPAVAFGGLQVGGIRISHMSHIDGEKTVALMVTRGRKAPFKVLPLAEARQETAARDFGAILAELEQVAVPGNIEALGEKWQSIGADARKALAEHLPRLKAACEKPAPAADDVVAPWLKAIADTTDLADVDRLDKESETDRAFMTPEQIDQLDEAIATKRAALREAAQAAVAE